MTWPIIVLVATTDKNPFCVPRASHFPSYFMFHHNLAPSDGDNVVVSAASPLGLIWLQSLNLYHAQDLIVALAGWLTETVLLSLHEITAVKYCSLNGYPLIKYCACRQVAILTVRDFQKVIIMSSYYVSGKGCHSYR